MLQDATPILQVAIHIMAAGSCGANEKTLTSEAWVWESSASKAVAIVIKSAEFTATGLLVADEETSTSAAWGGSAGSGAAYAKLMPNAKLLKADPLAIIEETSPSAVDGEMAAATGEGIVNMATRTLRVREQTGDRKRR